MKVLANETKRILAVLLSVAMIFAYVPSNIYAAETTSDDGIIEEDAQADEVVEEEVKTDDALAAADSQEPEEAEEVKDDELDAKADVQIKFVATDARPTTLKANIYRYYSDVEKPHTALVSTTDVTEYADHEQDYVFMVEPKDGLAFTLLADGVSEDDGGKALLKGTYRDYSTKTTGKNQTVEEGETTIALSNPSVDEAKYYNKGTKKVTIKAATLAAVYGAMSSDAGVLDDGILTLNFQTTASAAKWKLGGFDLKDVDELGSYAPGYVTLTNDADYNLTLTNVLDLHSYSPAALTVKVLVYNEKDELVLNSTALNSTAIDLNAATGTFGDMKGTDKNGDAVAGTKHWAQYDGSVTGGKLTISGRAISLCYLANYKLFVDVTAGTIGTVKVTTTADSEKVATFEETTASTTPNLGANEASALVKSTPNATFDSTGSNDFVFNIQKKSPYDYVHAVSWTIDGKSDKSYKFDVPAAQSTNFKVKIPKEDLKKGDAVVTVTGGFSVGKLGGTGAYRILDKDGVNVTQTEAGKDFVFQIAPQNGHAVSSVTYTVGGGSSKVADTNTDGTFTIKKENLKGSILLNPDIADAGSTAQYLVKTADNYIDGTTHKGVVVKRLDSANTPINNGGTLVKKNDPLIFTVTSTRESNPNVDDNVIEEVSYSMGGATYQVLTPVYGKTYKIASITGETTIKVVYRAQAYVVAPYNKNVTVNFAAAGEGVYVPEGSFNFTITPKDSSVEVKEISYNNTDGKAATPAVKTLDTKTGGTISVTSGTTYYLVVKTEEKVSDSSFRAIFNNANDKIEKTYTDETKKTEMNLKDQTLKLVMGDAQQTVTAQYKPIKNDKLRDPIVAADAADGYYATEPETTDVITYTKDSQDVVKITPKKVGAVDMTVAYKYKDGLYGNTLVYPGKLKVSVTQAYTDLRIETDKDTGYAFSGTANTQNLDIVKLDVRGKNGQTGILEDVNTQTSRDVVKSIEWSFVPSTDQLQAADYKHAFVTGPTASAVTGGTAGKSITNSASNTSYVCAKEAEAVTVKAIVTFKDNTQETLTKKLTFIDPLEESYFMTRSVSGAINSFDMFKTATNPAVYNHNNPVELGLNATDKKNVTVKYAFYRLVDTTLNQNDYDEEDEIADLLKKGKIVVAENVSFGKATLKNMNATDVEDLKDKNEYVTFADTTGGFTVTASKEITNGNHVKIVAPDVTVSGVKVPELNFVNRSMTFTVSNAINKYKVELVTVDDQSVDEETTEVVNKVQTLKDTYIDGRVYSKVENTYDPDEGAVQIGVEFNAIGRDSSFRLPTESDFSTEPYEKKTLLGWAKATYNAAGPDVVTDSNGDNLADVVVKPGAYVTVDNNVGYKAIWVDKYISFDNTTNIGDDTKSAIYMYDDSKTYIDDENKKQYGKLIPQSPSTIEKGYELPVVIGVGKVKSIRNTNKVFKLNTTPMSVALSEINVEPEYYDSNFTLTAKGEDSVYNLDKTALDARKIKASDTADVTKVADINVEFTDKDRAANKYKEAKAVKFAEPTESTVAVTGINYTDANQEEAKAKEAGETITLTGALTDGELGKAVKLLAAGVAEDTSKTPAEVSYYTYNYNWTSSDPTVASIEAGKKEDQYTAALKPLKAGTTTIGLSIVKSGKEIAKKTFTLTVEASDVAFVFADTEGHTGITEVLAQAGALYNAANVGKFKVKVTNKAGKALTGGKFTFGLATDYNKNKVINGTDQAAAAAAGLSGDAEGYTIVPVSTKDFVGSDTLHVKYEVTVSGKKEVYQKDIKVKTYYSVVLDPSDNPKYFITKNGVKQMGGTDGKTQVPVEIKLTEDDLKDVTATTYSKASDLNKKDFNFKAISLEGYSAIYYDPADPDNKNTFSNWKVDTLTTAYPNDSAKNYKENDTISKLIGFKYANGNPAIGAANSSSNFEAGKGTYTLKPVMFVARTLTGVPGEITMNYDPTGANNSKTVKLTIDPADDGVTLDVKGAKQGFYSISTDGSDTNASKVNKATTTSGGDGKTEFVIKAYNFMTNTYSVSNKTTWQAGVDTVGIYGGSAVKPLASINLYVNGLDYDASTKKVQYYENGEVVKSDYRTVAGNTYYFDADGNWIESTGITKINGKDVLIIDGVVAPKGKRIHDGNTYFVGDSGVILTGWLTADGAAATAANGVYYADPAASGKLVKGLTTIDSKKYVFGSDNRLSRASSSANTYEEVNGYYVNAAGEIAENGIFKVNGVDRLFRENATIVLFSDTDVEKSTTDVEHGKIKVGGKTYIIEKTTNMAKLDDIPYNPTVAWTTPVWPSKVTKGDAAPTLSYRVTYTSKNTGNSVTTDPVTVIATTTDNFDKGSTAEFVTFTAVADLSAYFADSEGKTPAQNVIITQKYTFKDGGPEGISKTYTFKSIKKWNWPDKLVDGGKPTVTADIIYTVKEDGQADTTETINTTASVSDGVDKGSKLEFTATVTTLDGQTKTDKNEYNKKSGKEQTDDNETESEPEQSEVDNYKSYNLFYNDTEIPVDGLSAALAEDGAAKVGKWQNFFEVDGDTVKVSGSADAKKAVNAGNSLITVTYDGGQFNYQLPVYYQKPALKLTSTSGTILKGKTEATTLHTKVTEKKSNGLYEPLEIAEEDVKFEPGKNKTAPESFAPGSNDGEIEIGAKAATAGKINVKKENWRETIALSYSVKESKKDVITADTKAVTLNTKAETVDAQTVELKLNGEDLSDENKVTVTLPKNWSNAGVEGVAAGDLTDGKLSLTLTGDAIHKKGSYNVNFTTGNKGKFTLKVTISETAVDRAFKLNIKSKMDVTRGQKMVLEPKFNGASGPITGVDIKTDGSNFTAEWVEAKNQIVVGVADGKTVAKGKYTETFTITSGGQEYPITLKNFQVNATKPTVKLAKVTLPKSKITGEDGAEGKTNINATYKQNGKTFGIAPEKVEFMVGKNAAAESKDESGWYVVNTANNVLAQYDEATGVINVKVKNSTGKAGSVKVSMTFPGGTVVTKSFTVAAK